MDIVEVYYGISVIVLNYSQVLSVADGLFSINLPYLKLFLSKVDDDS